MPSPHLIASLRLGSRSAGPFTSVAAKAYQCLVAYGVTAVVSIAVSIVGDSLSLRLNAFMALHGLVVLCGGLLALAATVGASDEEGWLGANMVLGALGLGGRSQKASCSAAPSSSSCGSHGHSHDHQDEDHRGCGHGHSLRHNGPALNVAPSCRAAFPSDLSRVDLIFGFAADIIVFFTAVSTIVEAFQRLAHHHDEAPVATHIVSLLHVAVAVYHYLAVVQWVGEGGRRSPFLTAPALVARNDAIAMVLSPIGCSLGCAVVTFTHLSRVDVLVALLLSVYVGSWSGGRLVRAAKVLTARSPLVGDRGTFLGGDGGASVGVGTVGRSLTSPFSSPLQYASGGGGQYSQQSTSLATLFNKALLDCRMVHGVLDIRHVVWPLSTHCSSSSSGGGAGGSNGSMGAHVHLLLSRDASEDSVGHEVRSLFSGCVASLIVECERQSMTTAGAGHGGMMMMMSPNHNNGGNGHAHAMHSASSAFGPMMSSSSSTAPYSLPPYGGALSTSTHPYHNSSSYHGGGASSLDASKGGMDSYNVSATTINTTTAASYRGGGNAMGSVTQPPPAMTMTMAPLQPAFGMGNGGGVSNTVPFGSNSSNYQLPPPPPLPTATMPFPFPRTMPAPPVMTSGGGGSSFPMPPPRPTM